MPDLPKNKVGIVACSGEDLPEGTVTRLAALKILEELRPAETVTICLPLFLAGGEGDRAFARFYPTIAIDGCELRCAARGTEKYSGKPAAGVVVTEIAAEARIKKIAGSRRLNSAGMQAVELTASRVTGLVDELISKHWSRRKGEFVADTILPIFETEQPAEPIVASCACGSGIPVQDLIINGEKITLVALPLIFEQTYHSGKLPKDVNPDELLATVKIYNLIPKAAEEEYKAVLMNEYTAYCLRQEVHA